MQGGKETKRRIRRLEKEKQTGEVLSDELNKIKEKFKITEDNKKSMIETADDAFKEYMEKYEDLKQVIDPGVIPIGMGVLTTASIMSIDETGRWLTANNFNITSIQQAADELSETQVVIAVGPSCQQVKKGDTIVFDRSSFKRIANPNSIKSEEVDDILKVIKYINGRPYLLMHERDIIYIKERKQE